MEYPIADKLEWLMIFIYEFGRKFQLSRLQAFRYLKRYHAIAFIDEHYGFVHTQSFEDMINDISAYCRRQGGTL
jgi:hypothetical protein